MSAIIAPPSLPTSLPDDVLAGEALLRAEVYSSDQLERHAGALARLHRVDGGRGRNLLLPRLTDNAEVLRRSFDHLRAAAAIGALVPAGDWLLDNQHLILGEVALVRRHLPRGYSRELPRLIAGDPLGMPRVYALALELISHADGRADADSLDRFLVAYQTVAPLALGELWAMPIMLRLALIENLRRIAARVDGVQQQRRDAAVWAERLLRVAEDNPSSLVIEIADLARADLVAAGFVAELHRLLHGRHHGVALVLQWLDQRLAERQLTVAELIRSDNQVQAADQVAVGNAITSLRGMDGIDWRTFVERLSPVEAVLRRDPAGVYAGMDFATRDRYRHAVESLARRCPAASADAERQVAEAAVARAQAAEAVAASATPVGDRPPADHVGWWLIGPGSAAFESDLVRSAGLLRPRRQSGQPRRLRVYAWPIVVLTAVVAVAIASASDAFALTPWLTAVVVALAVLPASQAALTLVNWLATRTVAPQRPPRLDLDAGIPLHLRTAVAVPTLLRTPADADALAEGLEVRYLANRDEQLAFVLLTDFADAPTADLAGDQALLERAAAVISDLNRRHPRAGGDRFLLLHRPRLWNPRQGVWMGRERKRGKIADFNRLLLSGERAPFSRIVGDPGSLAGTRLVIVLDTDTRLPRDAARGMIAAIAHPLNRPRAAADGSVRGGHGVLQPRAAIALTSARRTWYARLWSGDAGIDPYTRAVSDVYQDWFDEGSFIGKGIYDLAAFEHAAGARFPDDAILSHDLVEGCFARAGLVSDVLVVEDHPATWLADAARRSRWVRGDWQLLPWLLPWLLPRIAHSGTGRVRNPLSALSRWKIADNLRRSLLPAATLALLVAGWLLLPADGAAVITAVVLGIALLPTVLGTAGAMSWPAEGRWPAHLAAIAAGATAGAVVALAELALLPFTAVSTLSAIARTLWRLVISRRRLLEWQTASDAEAAAARSLAGVVWTMAWAPLAGGAAIALVAWQPTLTAVVLPWAVAWMGGPLLAWALSRPRRLEAPPLAAADAVYLAAAARRTWRYFSEQVTAHDRFLPPDNVQEQPVAAVAHRTSPTNIGFALTADLAAHDFGWLTTAGLLDRVEATLTSVSSLEMHRGHLLNWYDTTTGAPLAPRYVSTVDSGNLAGLLLVLAAGLRELPGRAVDPAARLRGCATTLALAADEPGPAAATLHALARRLAEAPAGAQAGLRCAEEAVSALATVAGGHGEWLAAASAELSAQRDELATLLGRCITAATPTLDILARGGAGAPVEAAALLVVRARRLADHAERLALAPEWGYLFNPHTRLFSIGFHVDDARLDRSSYDLLASESRLGSFVAVATGGIPQEHWFHLGRQLARTSGGPALVSWGGTMFEYLMPSLVMDEEPGALLAASNQAAVAAQRRYADQCGIPWGISESAYHRTDAALNWQYRAFGVPGLGLKRGLADDLVVAPYASALALLVDAPAAVANLRRLDLLGASGRFGFCEAVDFTTERLPQGSDHVVIRSWMAHHQGMTLLAIQHVLHGAPMRRRFLADRRLQAHRLLLQERPAGAGAAVVEAAVEAPEARTSGEPSLRVVTQPMTPQPEVHLLSNGRYHVLVTAAGGGASRWRDLAVFRWREDPTRDHWGPFCYLRDLDDGRLWSTAHQPVGAPAETYEAVFTQARAEFRRSDRGIIAHTEIAVSPEDDIELRRVTLSNRGDRQRRIEITTYAEPVLAPPAADLAHPAFANLFVETFADAEREAVLVSRRPRRPDELRPWLVHLLAVREGESTPATWETSREAFVGRGRSPGDPQACSGAAGGLSGTVGAVLDPALAMRRTVIVPAGGRVVVDIVYAVADSRAAVLALADRYRDAHLAERVFSLSWTHGQVVLAQIGATEAEAQAFARLAGSLIYAGPPRRASSAAILRNRRTRSGLWSHGISGDLPICLMQVADGQRLDLLRQVLRAHAWWRAKGLAVDLVVLIEDPSVYRQEVTERVLGLVAAGPDAALVDRSGGVFVRRADQVPEEDRHLLLAVSRLVIADAGGTLAQFVDRRLRADPAPPRLRPPRVLRSDGPGPVPTFDDLLFDNGIGGFTRDGREYIITLRPGATTPAPWCNVLANPGFGTVISERGAAYTWAENCHEFRLTPWRCDAVSDPAGEALYLRDEDSGIAWSPTPGPCRGRGNYVCRHGFGYSAFVSHEEGVLCELHTWVDLEAPLKHLRLRLTNTSARPRRLTATSWLEWTLGESRERTAMHLACDHEDGVLYARNPFSDDFSQRCAFVASDRRPQSWTCDRGEFLGRNGSPARPAALTAMRLLSRAGAGLDPGAALQIAVDLDPGEEQELVFTIGAGRDREHARELARRHCGLDAARDSLARVYEHWKQVLSAVQVKTSEPALDLLVNGWLPYQVISARLHARSGFYQSGGAFGFRDQLQDAMAMVHHSPHLLREQLLRAAARQFREGDVQHWWHPPKGRGVRTRISDDYLWLPYALCRYLDRTQDRAILAVRIPYLDGAQVPPDQDALYDLPTPADEHGSLYDHAVRALLRGLRFGVHGLPLIGTGDWNDGMDRVGHHGRGESVWLGFFLHDVLVRFAPLAADAGDGALADRLLGEAAGLAKRLDEHAWDGGWYLRAWFDDGSTLGGHGAEECSIDALPQSWAAITGAGDRGRARAAMEAVDNRLVRRDQGLVQLFDPPFDHGSAQPGYIKGYLPGVRENGGQYTHAAVWTAMGFAALGDATRAWDLARLINPVLSAGTPAGAARWRGEPYVVAADVYRTPGHVGQAGWTWYTGSAGWLWRLLAESLLGLDLRGDRLRLRPCLPPGFPPYAITLRHGASRWTIHLSGSGPVRGVAVDGVQQPGIEITLVDDGADHRVEVGLGVPLADVLVQTGPAP